MAKLSNCLTFGFILMASLAKSQGLGMVVDADDRTPIAGALVISGDTSTTDARGMFRYDNQSDITISSYGYITKSISSDTTRRLIVAIEPDPILLAAITVNSLGIEEMNQQYPASIGYIAPNIISRNDPTIITHALNNVPGVFMHSGALNTNRITIRGIGSRSPFSTNKIRAYYEDIPLTNGSGETTIEDIDLAAVGSMQVIKGPNSSLYGSGLGGTIAISRAKAFNQTRQIFADFTMGDFGLFRTNIGYASNQESNDSFISYNRQTSDGYRDNNNFERNAFLAASGFYFQDDKIDFIAYYLNQYAQIPSSLNEDDYLNDPTKAAFTWGQAQGFEDYDKFLLGVSWDHAYSSRISQQTSIYANFIDSYEARPFNILKDNTTGLGIRSRLTSEIGRNSQLMVGFELFQDWYGWRTYDNLYQDFPGQGSILGGLLSDNQELRKYYNVFGQANISLARNTRLELGVNINQTDYRLKDYFVPDSTDHSGQYGFDPIVSPRIGLSHDINQLTTAYLSISHGFSPPTLEETLAPDGNINPEIQPETGWNLEIGAKGSFWQNRIGYGVALYNMQISNLLVARRTAEDQYVGINAGSTIHNGIELNTQAKLISNDPLELTTSLNYTLSAFRFDEFEDDDQDYSGNELTGVPKNQLGLTISAIAWKMVFANIAYQWIDEMPITDDNSIYSDAYQLVNFQIGVSHQVFDDLNIELSYRLNNALDEKYASMHQINASGFGGAAPRYYYPGLPRHQMVTLKMKFAL